MWGEWGKWGGDGCLKRVGDELLLFNGVILEVVCLFYGFAMAIEGFVAR